ncbi:MAG: hypothetical protein ACYCPN_04250 [Thermoplasmata archaeon]
MADPNLMDGWGRAMLRGTLFYVGALLIWGLSAAFIVALLWSGAGWIFFEAYGGAVLGFILGGFFWFAGRSARHAHRELTDWDGGPTDGSRKP